MSVTRANLPGTMLHEFSLLTKADKVPTGPDWLHEVKYDGYRMMLIRKQGRVCLISGGGYDLTRCFPLIVEGAVTSPHREPCIGILVGVAIGIDVMIAPAII